MNIAIAGYGVEGEENYTYWSQDPSNQLTIVDESETPGRPVPDGVKTILGEGAFSKLDGFDLVIRTAGLAPHKLKTSAKVWSATNEFFEKCPAPIIGVTGTKGKGTTSSLIASILEASGRNTWLVGNIGVAALGVLPFVHAEDIVVFELSSFQLWDIERSPQTAVVLLVEPDHLNVHADMDEYVEAKAGITRYQKQDDYCVYHPTNPQSRRVAFMSPALHKERYAVDEDEGVYVSEGMFRTRERTICAVSALQLRGVHNQENACAAITAALQYGVSNDAIEQGLLNLERLPHRLEFVRTVEGVDYYNDSFSSAPAATVAAIRSFEQPEIVIVGGVDKGADFSILAEELRQRANIKEVVLIGRMRNELRDIFAEHTAGVPLTVLDSTTMQEIVAYVKGRAVQGDVVLLSPACASFDMFKDFYDRGDQFRQEIMGL